MFRLSQVLLSILLPAIAAAQDYVVVDLGVIGDGPSEARGINNAGEVTGFSQTGELAPPFDFPVRRGFVWLPAPAYGLTAGLTDLGTVATLPLRSSIANDISDAGLIAGSSENGGTTQFGDPIRVPFTAVGDVLDPLPLPAFISFSADARAVNGRGEIAVSESLGFGCRDYLWLPAAAYGLDAGYYRLPRLDGLNEGSAFDINDRGQVVGFKTGACDALGGGNPAFLWLPEPAYGLGAGIHDVTPPNLDKGVDAAAVALNESGQIVGELDYGLIDEGFLWDLGAFTDLPFSPADINASGWIVGNRTGGPVLWRAGQITALGDLLVPGSGWSIQRVTGINDRGQIVGVASKPGVGGGQGRAVLLDLAQLFADGFESGDTSAWSAAAP